MRIQLIGTLCLLLFAQVAWGNATLKKPPEPVAIGTVPVGMTITQAVTLENMGPDKFTITNVGIIPTPSDFKVCEHLDPAPSPPTCSPLGFPLPINAGTTLTFDVQFSPQTMGTVIVAVAFFHSDPSVPQNPYTINVTGTGSSAATLNVNPNSLTFTLTKGKNCNPRQELHLTGGTQIYKVDLVPPTAPFGLCLGQSGTCSSFDATLSSVQVTSGSTTDITVAYTAWFGDRTGSVVFTPQGATTPAATVNLSGSGSCLQIVPPDIVCRFPCFIWQDPRLWLIDPQIWMTILILPIFVLSLATVVGSPLNTVQSKVLLGILGLVAIAAGGKIGAAAVAVTTVAASVKALSGKVNARR